jgi:hypothetical protein
LKFEALHSRLLKKSGSPFEKEPVPDWIREGKGGFDNPLSGMINRDSHSPFLKGRGSDTGQESTMTEQDIAWVY